MYMCVQSYSKSVLTFLSVHTDRTVCLSDGLFAFACAHISICVCVRHILVPVSVSDGQPNIQDMTADWQTDHQHSSWQPQRTLSACQEEFT